MRPPFLPAADAHTARFRDRFLDAMDAGTVDSDRDEVRSARLHSLSVGDWHPPDCTCRPCQVERSGLSDAEIRGAT